MWIFSILLTETALQCVFLFVKIFFATVLKCSCHRPPRLVFFCVFTRIKRHIFERMTFGRKITLGSLLTIVGASTGLYDRVQNSDYLNYQHFLNFQAARFPIVQILQKVHGLQSDTLVIFISVYLNYLYFLNFQHFRHYRD